MNEFVMQINELKKNNNNIMLINKKQIGIKVQFYIKHSLYILYLQYIYIYIYICLHTN